MKRIFCALIIMFFAAPSFAENTGPLSTVLKPVETEFVCMVNDTVFQSTQIPVEVDGKMYYGCCMGCVDRLKQDVSIRFSVDPISGREVDKAKAIIGVAPDNHAYYFESLENLEQYK
jgi:YHS domain-containing protein